MNGHIAKPFDPHELAVELYRNIAGSNDDDPLHASEQAPDCSLRRPNNE
jgi:hypothetical protein